MQYFLNSICATKKAAFSMSIVALCVQSAAVANYEYDNSVAYFEQIRQAGAKNDLTALFEYESLTKNTLFAMYAPYYRLNASIKTLHPNAVIDFVRQYPNSVMAEKLAADYAEEQARLGNYANVNQIAPFIINADESEACALVLGQLHAGANATSDGDANLQAQKTRWWLDSYARKKPELCQKMLQSLQYSATEDEAYARLIRLMRMDGRQLSSKRPAENTRMDIIFLANRLNLTIDSIMLDAIASNPNAFITNFHTNYPDYVPKSAQYLYLYAIGQLAHRSYEAAASQLDYDSKYQSLAQKLDAKILAFAWRTVAVMRMNMNTDDGFSPMAVRYFQNSLDAPFNAEEAEDYAQAAIYFGQWDDVLRAIWSMPEHMRTERRFLYWQARAMLAKNPNDAAAIQIYQNLADDIDYYGLLARARLGQPLRLQDIGGNVLPNLSQQDYAKVYADANFARALKLIQVGANEADTNREFRWAVRRAQSNNNPRLIVLAATVAQRLGSYPHSIYAIQNTSQARNGALSHPTPFLSSVNAYSARFGVDSAWGYGVIRQESRFVAHARSSANAQGLMQMLPSTAQNVAAKLGYASPGNLYNPDTSIQYGMRYLSDQLATFSGKYAVATAAYNAGARPARAWQPKHASIDADQYIENIVYAETQQYVKNVLENAVIYSTILGAPKSMHDYMGKI